MSADELLDGLTTPEEIAKIEKSPAALVRLANILLSSGRTARAVELARRALSLAPEDGEVQSVATAVLRESVERHQIDRDNRHAAGARPELLAQRREIRQPAVIEFGVDHLCQLGLAGQAGDGRAVPSSATEGADRPRSGSRWPC